MTYEVYAMYPEGAYKVAEGNDSEHCTDLAERACKAINQWPWGFVTIIRGEHVINAEIFTFEDLKKRNK